MSIYRSEPKYDADYIVYKAPPFFYAKANPETGLSDIPQVSGAADSVIQSCINNLTGVSPVKRYGIVKLTTEVFPQLSGITTYPGVGIVGAGPLSAFSGFGTCALQPVSGMVAPSITVVVDPNNTGNSVFPFLADFSINGPNLTLSGQHGIDIEDVNGTINDVYINRVGIFSMGGDGIHIKNGGKHWLDQIYSEDNRLNGINVLSSNRFRLTHSYIFGNLQIGLNITNSPIPTFVSVLENEFSMNVQQGAKLRVAGPSIFSKNNLYNNGGNTVAQLDLFGVNPSPAFLSIEGNTISEDRVAGTRSKYAINISTSGTVIADVLNNPCIGTYLTSVFNVAASNVQSGLSVRGNRGINPWGVLVSGFDNTNSQIGIGLAAATSTPASGITYTDVILDLEVYLVGIQGNATQKNGTAVTGTSGNAMIMLEPGDTINFGTPATTTILVGR